MTLRLFSNISQDSFLVARVGVLRCLIVWKGGTNRASVPALCERHLLLPTSTLQKIFDFQLKMSSKHHGDNTILLALQC